MEIKSLFAHANINVSDINRSIDFYKRALGLTEGRRIEGKNGEFTIVFMDDSEGQSLLELTWLRDHEGAYDLGDNESHICYRVAGDYDAIHSYHNEMGCVCYENTDMGLYFINDPDDYWIEVLPLRK